MIFICKESGIRQAFDLFFIQAATNRLPDCPGQSFFFFGLGNHDYRRIARPGKFKSEVSLHQSYHTSYKHQK